MSSIEKIINKILSGKSDNNIDFNDLKKVVLSFGFNERIEGSHHVFTQKYYNILINLQKDRGSKAKPYQVKQVRKIIIQYFLNE